MQKLWSIFLVFTIFTADAQEVGLGVSNDSLRDISVECFPSQHICNGVGTSGGSCMCDPNDSTMYVGRITVPQSQAVLDSMVVHEINFANYSDGDWNDYRVMSGHEFKFDFDPNNSFEQTCDLYGDPTISVNCNFECNDGSGGSSC